MELQQQNRLAPIQEESEQENDFEGSEPGEEEEENQIQGGVEAKEVMAGEESDEDEDDDDTSLLRVMRPRRMSRSLSEENFPQNSTSNDYYEEMESFSLSERNSHGVDLRDEAAPPEQTSVGNRRRSISAVLRMKTSKFRWQKYKPAVQKRTKRQRHKKTLVEELFPEWVVNLMVNIEEATTHQLLVE